MLWSKDGAHRWNKCFHDRVLKWTNKVRKIHRVDPILDTVNAALYVPIVDETKYPLMQASWYIQNKLDLDPHFKEPLTMKAMATAPSLRVANYLTPAHTPPPIPPALAGVIETVWGTAAIINIDPATIFC